MKKSNTLIKSRTETVIGIDLGDKKSHICVLNEGGACVETGTVVTTPSGFEGRFTRIDPCRIAIEAIAIAPNPSTFAPSESSIPLPRGPFCAQCRTINPMLAPAH
ncbi:MAG: hypothetical protein ACI87O_002259, partial [Planctomycetota bacterium]